MSADGSVTLPWAGENRRFRLAIGQLRELQEGVNKWRVAIGAPPIGPRTLLRLLVEGDGWIDEIREVIRLGLIGGGMKIDLVPGLVKRYVDERPLMESAQVAQAILLTALVGDVDDPVGKHPAETAATEARATASSSPQSTAPVARSGSARGKSTISRSGNSAPV